MRVPYNWLLEYLETDASAEQLGEVLTMGGVEVERIENWTSEDGQATDRVLITSVTANRGDLLSMVGVARHAAALLDCNWHPPDWQRPETDDPIVDEPLIEQSDVQVETIDFQGCPRYSALVIRDIEMAESPDWMKYHLQAAGVRPISNIVDATNYLCWELGQPMHAFDLRLLARDHIIVRKAESTESILLMDGTKVDLTENDLAICDEMGPVALAGVMGGSDTQVSERTNSILLESAHFDPTTIRRTSQRHAVSSESSYRFERHVDPNLTLRALARATNLILESTDGDIESAAIDVRKKEFEPKETTMRPERCNELLGTDIRPQEMVNYLSRLDLEPNIRNEKVHVRVPTFRPDIKREVDLIEEVAIVHGYNEVPLTVPGKLREAGVRTSRQRAEQRTRAILRQCGLNETIHFSFMDDGDIDRCELPADSGARDALELQLPVSADMAALRTTLLPALLSACEHNVNQRVLDVALFELQRVFLPREGEQLPEEQMRIAGIAMGSPMTADWNLPEQVTEVDFYWMKGVVEELCSGLNVGEFDIVRGEHPTLHPGQCARLVAGGRTAGHFGRIKHSVQEAYDLPVAAHVFEFNWDLLIENADVYRQYEPLPRFPAAQRDIAVVVPDDEEHLAAALEYTIKQAGPDTLYDIEPFDTYTDPETIGEGQKSIAFHLKFRAMDRTLTDEELDEAIADIVDHLSEELDAEIRAE